MKTTADTMNVSLAISRVQSGRNGGELRMTSRHRFLVKLNGVTLKEMRDGKFQLRITKPYDQKRVLSCSLAEAQQIAIEAAQNVSQGIYGGATADPEIRPALIEAIKASRANVETKSRYVRGANAFVAFMEAKHPQTRQWSEVRPSMIRGWFQSMEAANVAYDTIRLALVPVKQASAYWAAEYPRKFEDVAKLAKLRQSARLKTAVVALSGESLVHLLEWVRLNDPLLYPVLLLCGTAGLRIREAAALRYRDLDLAGRNVTVAETPWHKPKNRASYRTVPVLDETLAAIQEHFATAPVQGAGSDSPVFFHSRGGPWTQSALGDRCKNTLAMARASLSFRCVRPERALPEAFVFQKLRATFATLASLAGSRERYLKRQLGHTPGDILGTHYEAVSPDDLRREVLKPFERFWKNSGNLDLQNSEAKEVSLVTQGT